MIVSCGMTALATPTDSFVHDEVADGSTNAAVSQDMYSATKLITAQSLGLENRLSGGNDFCTDDEVKI
ncbi:MAG: hypothetical protein MJ132_01985 [Clostridia bacterium]|nr:hypothetical protein [Clostridia bacterium]